MATPAFEDVTPAGDCDCAGCVQGRLAASPPAPTGIGARHALVVAATAGTVIGGLQAAPASAQRADHHEVRPGDPAPPGEGTVSTPQGGTSPLHGAPGSAASSVELAPGAVRATTRAAIINRAKTWVASRVPYDMNRYWKDGYRQDCSGFVSMAWDLPGNEWTGSLARYGTKISKADLQPGDILLFHNPDDPEKGSHVVIFGGWTDYTRSYYMAYEQTRPATRRQATPYKYWSYSSRYVAYRYKGVKAGSTSGSASTTKFPGAQAFGPGANNAYVTQLGRLLVERGGKRFYTEGPGPRWGEADRKATQAFQKAQGWTGADADGIPGPTTWSYLVTGKGKDIPADGAGGPEADRVPAYPGASAFRPGASSDAVTRMGRQLVKKGFGKYYTQGPGPRWGEADRRAVEAFQRAQGWSGREADGYPGPETWRRLFS
ncbi:peptidoglycan-binding protein [Streptomyces xanthii]|uniref:Peptidoglycan-binding protein n=1 Tax=Streptomyces xanthii TaxID=2768069 RepID=A0A7H1BJI3_9ACTN|nr:peptidoglycan-binding protein [Streptomyces xanthii]QNS08888.1 peptidoglycan-binding protein [Streptomyces xanthii]